jgi:anti-anti-sigma factor
MKVNFQSDTNIHLVKLSGVLNANQEQEIGKLFRSLAEQDVNQVIVDLQDVPLIDSRGLVSLISGYKTFGSKAENFRLAGLNDQPKLVFELTGFDQIFQIYDDLPEAMEESELVVELPPPQAIPVVVAQFAATPLVM